MVYKYYQGQRCSLYCLKIIISMRLSFNLQIGHGIIIRIPLKKNWTKRKLCSHAISTSKVLVNLKSQHKQKIVVVTFHLNNHTLAVVTLEFYNKISNM